MSHLECLVRRLRDARRAYRADPTADRAVALVAIEEQVDAELDRLGAEAHRNQEDVRREP
jgi:hypothetical protein